MAVYEKQLPHWGSKLRLTVNQHSQDKPNNRSRVSYSLQIIKTGGYAWSNYSATWSVNLGGLTASGSISSYNFGNYSSLTLGSGTSNWITHNADGRKSITVSGTFSDPSGSVGSGSVSGSLTFTRIPKVPSAPSAPSGFSPGTTSFSFLPGTSSNNNGAAISTYQFQVSTNSSFSNVVSTFTGNNARKTVTGLVPAQTYWVRSRARNSVGYSNWSVSRSTTTLNVTPPTLTISADPTGKTASLSLTPPSTLPNPSSYRIQRRVKGQTSVITFTTTSRSPSYTVTPGVTYEWRVAVLQGSFVSNYSSWDELTQPKPNLNPGDYFDGATADDEDFRYVWWGTAHTSTSRKVGIFESSWDVWATVGGFDEIEYAPSLNLLPTGEHSARLDIVREPPDQSIRVGLGGSSANNLAQVAEGGEYTGSMYVRVEGQPKTLRVGIQWRTGSASLGTTFGDPIDFPDGGDYVRVHATGIAPQGAESAVAYVIDMASDHTDHWRVGSTLFADRMQIELGSLSRYFDGSMQSDDFEYEWTGTAWESPSTAVLVPESQKPDPLADPDCAPIPVPPSVPPIIDECVIEVGQWRRYWSIIPAEEVSRWAATLPSLTITSGDIPARQVRIRYYPNPDDVPLTDYIAEEWEAEQIVSYLPANTSLALDAVTQRASALTPGATHWRHADHLLYGTDGTPATWPVLDCGKAYFIALDVPIDAPDGNIVTQIELTRRY